jgi:putative membrane protein
MKLFSNEIELNAKTKLTLALCTVLALSAASLRADDKDKNEPGAGTTSTTSKLNRSDEKFVREAAKGGMMEVHMGKLGVQKAQNDQVKQFAQRLVDDHTKANSELKQLASSKGITLPNSDHITSTTITTDADRTQVREQANADKQHKELSTMMKKLEGLSGTDFDRTFVKMAVTDHEKDVKEFEKASEKCDDAEIKAFAAKTLPTLREHLTQAKSLQTQVGNVGAPGSDSESEAGAERSKSQSGGNGTATPQSK